MASTHLKFHCDTADAATILGVSTRTVQRMVHRGELRIAYRVEHGPINAYRFVRSEVEAAAPSRSALNPTH